MKRDEVIEQIITHRVLRIVDDLHNGDSDSLYELVREGTPGIENLSDKELIDDYEIYFSQNITIEEDDEEYEDEDNEMDL